METKIKIDRVQIAFQVDYTDISSSETSAHVFSDSFNVGLSEDSNLTETLLGKEIFGQIIPMLVKSLMSVHGFDEKIAKQHLKSIGL